MKHRTVVLFALALCCFMLACSDIPQSLRAGISIVATDEGGALQGGVHSYCPDKTCRHISFDQKQLSSIATTDDDRAFVAAIGEFQEVELNGIGFSSHPYMTEKLKEEANDASRDS